MSLSWILESNISNSDILFAIILWIILVPLGIYTAMNPTSLQTSEQRLVRNILPDIIVNIFVRLMGILFAAGYSYILIVILIEKFG